MKANAKIPVTVITGFLGSGKTTLINRILTEEHGVRFAVIENEFGEVGIDQDLVIREKEEIVEMNNGCICCTVRGDLVRIITKLIESEKPPEHILIETTGLADPSPVAQTFLTDPTIAERVALDGIVTLVDARHVYAQLENTPEAKDQIAFADAVILNKTDLIDAAELKALESRIREINRFAAMYHSVRGNVDLRHLFNIGGFDVERALAVNPKFMEIEYPFEYGGFYRLGKGSYSVIASPNGDEKDMKILLMATPKEISERFLDTIANPAAILFSEPPTPRSSGDALTIAKEMQKLLIPKANATFSVDIREDQTCVLFTQHVPEEFSFALMDEFGVKIEPVISKEFRPAHSHDGAVTSVGVEIEGELDGNAFLHFIRSIIQAFGNELYRYKGIVAIEGKPNKIVLQGVHMLFEMQPSAPWGTGEKRKNAIIFIGKNLDRNILTQGFLSCIVQK